MNLRINTHLNNSDFHVLTINNLNAVLHKEYEVNAHVRGRVRLSVHYLTRLLVSQTTQGRIIVRFNVQ
jgi:translation initiation factor IF-1